MEDGHAHLEAKKERGFHLGSSQQGEDHPETNPAGGRSLGRGRMLSTNTPLRRLRRRGGAGGGYSAHPLPSHPVCPGGLQLESWPEGNLPVGATSPLPS